MTLSAAEALLWVARVISLALIVQSLELWSLRRVMADDGVWRWPIIRRDLHVFGAPLLRLFDALLGERAFVLVNLVRLGCAISLWFGPHAVSSVMLLLSTLLITLRFRGSFNGGSDFMTLVVLSGLCIATLFAEHALATIGALWYIALHACNSYFLAGLVKLRTANWRNGRALVGFMWSTIYRQPPLPRTWLQQGVMARMLSWSVIALECAFPLSLLHRGACLGLISVALCFHVFNAYALGLNRFVLAWAATYPALWWCSGRIL